MDLISVIVPVYNVENYVEQCLESVVNQTYKNIEVIVINDGSQDDSLKKCNKFLSDKRVKIIDKENEGLSRSRQLGIDNANGKYFCTVDSDDYIHESYIEELYTKIIETNSNICVCSRYDFKKEQIREISLNRETANQKIISKDDIEKRYCKFASNYVMSDSWNKMYDINFVRESGVRFNLDNIYNGTDLLFNYLLLLHQPKISVVKKPLYYHRNSEKSRVTRKNKQMMNGFMIITDKLIEESNKLNLDNEFNQQISQLYIRLQYLASKDLIFDNNSIYRLLKAYKKFLSSNKEYIEKRERLLWECSLDKKLSLNIMKSAIQKQNPYFLILYNKIYYVFKSINNHVKKINCKYQV